MKHLVVDFTHKLLLFVAILAIIVASVFSLLRSFSPWLSHHRPLIEKVISHALQHPVTIERLGIRWTRLQPVLQLQQVEIHDPSQGALFRLPEMDVQLDVLTSLWQQQWSFNRVVFKDAHLTLYQDPQQHWHLAGSEALVNFDKPNDAHSATAFLAWLLTIKHLQLSQFDLTVQAASVPPMTIQHLSVDFANAGQSHQLWMQALVNDQAPLQLAIQLHGAGKEFPQLDSDVYFAIHHFDPKAYLPLWSKAITWQQGLINVQVWGHWRQDHWQDIAATADSQDFAVSQGDKFPWTVRAQTGQIHGQWQPQQSQWQVQTQNGQVTLPTLFRQAIPFEAVQSQLKWQDQRLTMPYLAVQTPDIKVQAALSLQWPAQGAPVLDLKASTQLLGLKHTALYLPAGIMPKAVVDWLDRSVKGVTGGRAQMVFRGPVDRFPFDDHSGLMDIQGQLYGLHLNYWPGWPDMNDVDATVQFTHQGMRIVSEHGQQAGVVIDHVEAVLPHYASPALHIEARGHGDLQQGMAFIRQSPLKIPLATLADSNSQGPFHLHLNLAIPLSEQGQTRWQGEVALTSSQMRWANYPLALSQLQGQVFFSNDQVSSKDLTANLWGEPLSLSLHKQSQDQRLILQAQGRLNVQQWPWAFDFLTGKAPYNLQLALGSADGSEFWLRSGLEGMAITLPNGLSKIATEQTPLEIHGRLTEHANISQVDAQWSVSPTPITLTYRAQTAGGVWQLLAPQLAGSVFIPDDKQQPWQVNIHKGIWQSASSDHKDRPSHFDPTTLPAMNIEATHLLLGKQAIDQASVQLRPRSDRVVIPRFSLQTAFYQVTGKGQWSQDRSQVSGQLQTQQLASLLQSFDLPVFVSADQSQVQFQLQWPGAPWQWSLADSTGQLTTTLTRGSLPQVGADHRTSMGFGKALSLLSVNSLPQHLSLNFQDITDNGFSFNQLHGVFDLNQGRLKVPELTLQASMADVQSHGCINLEQENYQLVLHIMPHLTSSLPVLATLAGGPILGAVSFVANEVMSPTVANMTGRTYVLAGPWANPSNQAYPSDKAATAALHC